MYCVILVGAFRGIERHPYGSQSKHGTITQFCFNVGPASNTIDPAAFADTFEPELPPPR